jgi:hypothetical protein
MSDTDEVSDVIETPDRIQYYGSVVVLNAGSQLLMQRKTEGYPIEEYVDRLALIGGSWTHPEDASPRETLRRELDEELASDALHEAIDKRLAFLVAFDFELPELRSEKDDSFWARTFVFASSPGREFRETDAELHEGEGVIVDTPEQLDSRLCWGHEHALAHFGARAGLDFPNLPVPEASARLVGRDEPASYEEFDLDALVNNPLSDAPMEDLYQLGDD